MVESRVGKSCPLSTLGVKLWDSRLCLSKLLYLLIRKNFEAHVPMLKKMCLLLLVRV